MPNCPRCKFSWLDKESRKETIEARPNAFKPWSLEEDVKLHDLVKAGKDRIELMKALDRTLGAIEQRCFKLHLVIVDPVTPTPPKEKSQAEWDEEYRQQELRNVGIGT